MKRSEFNEVQKEELRRLIELSGDDPLFAPQLHERIAALDAERIEEDEDEFSVGLPRAAIFLRGGGVTGTRGIRPQLAGEALKQYEQMYVEQVLHDERQAAKDAGRQRRASGTPAPALLFTGTPRGSFGLEFVPVLPAEETLKGIHATALQHVSESLALVAEGGADESLAPVELRVPVTVLHPMKMFIRALVKYEAELRIVSSDGRASEITPTQLGNALERLDRTVEEEQVVEFATLRGVTLHSGRFDLVTDKDVLITGEVGSEVPESDVLRFHKLTNQRCEVILRKRTINVHARPSEVSYFLLGAKPIATPPAVAGTVPK